MSQMTHPVTGHVVTTEDSDASVQFWTKAGYRPTQEKKAPAKRAASKSTTAKK